MYLNMTPTKIYNVNEIEDMFRKVGIISRCKNNKRIEYYNAPCSFDIETTSFKVHLNGLEQKQAIMYVWGFSICGEICIGRTWKEFKLLCEKLQEWYETDDTKRIVVYIHNLPYEFQFIRKLFKWHKVFSLEKRKPVQAITIGGIEFRCSLKLSGYKLEKLADQLHKYKVRKLVGNLDYDKIRHSETELTQEELNYLINDNLVIIAYIAEQIEQLKYIYNIPLTATGYVRQYVKKYCFYGGEDKRDNNTYKKYKKFIKQLTLTPKVYTLLQQAFGGGFTHGNAYYIGDIIKNVRSKDFTSSYPYVMIAEKFPISTFEKVELKSTKEFSQYLKTHCCLFEIELFNVQPKFIYENYLSFSHCREVKGAVLNNGRIVRAEHLKTTITELDFKIIKKCYKWKKLNISNFHIAFKGYLPTNYVISILDMYEKKTTLKDVVGKEVEYMRSKNNVNSIYGMTVTDILRDEIEYDGEWTSQKPDIEEAIDKTNKAKNRFLYYAWGIWVTAYARTNLFSGIFALKDDYVYSDTDSVKYTNYEKHEQYFEWYNNIVIKKLKQAMNHHGIPFERTCPKNIKGEICQIGIWSDEGLYTRFKTLGAKRYITEKENKISLTVAGLDKKKAVKYLSETYKDKIFENFDNELYIPKGQTGKLTHTYIDYEQEGELEDYQGNIAYYHELSSVHLEPADYDLSISEQFVNYLLDIQTEKSI